MEDWYPYLIIPWGIFKKMISEKKNWMATMLLSGQVV